MKLNDRSYNDIKIGDVFEFNKIITDKELEAFAKLTEDFNPLHMDEEYAKRTKFKRRIVHGMLAGSFFSTLVGMVCLGKDNLYVTQSLNFKKPVYPNSELKIRGTVKDKIDSVKVIIINTEIIVDGEIVINGEAKVQVMGDQN